ncbi:uncharacterized protein [Porites lutea]|uniref:uncharacterized protein n=1 Tax=Porites lutea TaxID=51062 RepID=UPI003CC69FDA
MGSTDDLPIVNFEALSLKHEQVPDRDDPTVKELARQMVKHFSTVGFVYITNHGLTLEKVDAAFSAVDRFFTLESDVKRKYKKGEKASQNGWDALERESVNRREKTPGDLKECFDIKDFLEDDFLWPVEVPNFKEHVLDLWKDTHELSLRVLSTVTIGMGLDPTTFDFAFKHTGKLEGNSALRYTYYPKADPTKVKPGQLRCGEHTDLGIITMLYQDELGGLEFLSAEGKYVPAVPIKGSICINIGNMMQKLTSDRLIAGRHRVVVSEKEVNYLNQPRRSLVYFMRPDLDAQIECLDGSNEYVPIISGNYVKQK